MEFHVVIPVLISFAISLVLGPVVIPFLRRQNGTDRERAGRTVPPEEEWYTNHGRCDLPYCCLLYTSAL